MSQTKRYHLSVHGGSLFINREQGGRAQRELLETDQRLRQQADEMEK